jgi:hypothetical protein
MRQRKTVSAVIGPLLMLISSSLVQALDKSGAGGGGFINLAVPIPAGCFLNRTR